MHHPVWIEARTLRLPDDTTPVELDAHPQICMIQRMKRVRLTFPVTWPAYFGVGNCDTGKCGYINGLAPHIITFL